MKRVLLIGALLVATLSPQVLQAQISSKQAKADKLYEQLAFDAAIPLYEQLAKKNDHPSIKLKLADSYRLTQNFIKAEYWYEQIVTIDTLDAAVMLYYGQSLMANEKYSRARRWLEEYAEEKPDDPRGKNLAQACLRIAEISSNSFPCEVVNLPFNTSRSEFGPAFYQDGLVFASDRDTILGVKRTDQWYGSAFLELYHSAPQSDDTYSDWDKPRKLKGDVNGRFHEGPAVLAEEGSTMYFSRTNYKGINMSSKPGAGQDGLTKLKIFKARRAGADKWAITDETVIPFNSEEYSVAHPSISADGQTLYFASDMPGGYGGVDLYRAELLADGSSWGEPVNLGAQVNTAGMDAFPHIAADGNLYFASDGHAGYGGLDVFEARKDGDSWAEPINLGRPMNSSRDDYGLIFNENKTSGYVVSNRYGGKGRDDIYAVRNTGIVLTGRVFDEFTGREIEGAEVRLRFRNDLQEKQDSGEEGEYEFLVSTERTYELVVSKPGYKVKRLPAEVADLAFPAEVKLDVALEDTLLLRLVAQVIDRDSREPLANSQVMIYNKCTNENQELPTDEAGILRVRLEPNCTFYLAGRRSGYIDDNDVVSTSGFTESTELATILELTEIKEDLVIELKNIYYDYGRYYIREDAVGDLDNLSDLMEQYPSLKIEISSHTDSRGSDEFNRRLSQKRAETCVEYLVTKGIDRERLVARGYGEYVLKNDCANDVDCSEEEHQFNRRTEFKVLSFDKVLYSEEVSDPAVNIYKKAFGDDLVNRTRQDMINMGLIDPDPVTIVVQQNDNVVGPEPLQSSSSLLNRQTQATFDMVSSITDNVDSLPELPVEPAATLNPQGEDPLDVTILEPDQDPEELALPDSPTEVSEENSEWWKSGVSYAVQIQYGSENVDAFSQFADLGSIQVEYKGNGVPVVIIGYFRKFSEANSVQQTVRSRGVTDAFTVSYVDGQRLE